MAWAWVSATSSRNFFFSASEIQRFSVRKEGDTEALNFLRSETREAGTSEEVPAFRQIS